jgi:hypothetical protein
VRAYHFRQRPHAKFATKSPASRRRPKCYPQQKLQLPMPLLGRMRIRCAFSMTSLIECGRTASTWKGLYRTQERQYFNSATKSLALRRTAYSFLRLEC